MSPARHGSEERHPGISCHSYQDVAKGRESSGSVVAETMRTPSGVKKLQQEGIPCLVKSSSSMAVVSREVWEESQGW